MTVKHSEQFKQNLENNFSEFELEKRNEIQAKEVKGIIVIFSIFSIFSQLRNLFLFTNTIRRIYFTGE